MSKEEAIPCFKVLSQNCLQDEGIDKIIGITSLWDKIQNQSFQNMMCPNQNTTLHNWSLG